MLLLLFISKTYNQMRALREKTIFNYLSTIFFFSCYFQAIEHIRKSLEDSFILIVVDETADINGHYVANLLVGALSCDKLSRPFLIACKQLEKTNHSTITRFVNDGLKILWPGGGCDEKVLLMLSDAAPYMIKAAAILEILYPNMIHVTCAAHILQRIAERELYPDIYIGK